MSNQSQELVANDKMTLPPAFGGRLPGGVNELCSAIQQAMDTWLTKVKSERTRLAYRKDVEQFLDSLGIDLSHIEHMTRVLPEDVSNWRDELLRTGGRLDDQGMSTSGANSTVARKLTSLRSFFSFLQTYGYRGANPVHPQFVDMPDVSSEGQTHEISPKLMIKLLDAPDTSLPEGVQDRAILAAFVYMALRVDELHKINVGNIPCDGEYTIILIKGKGQKHRNGVVPPVAAKAINDWIELAGIAEDKRGPLFRPTQSPRGRGRDGFKRERLTIRPFQRLVKKYCVETGIDDTVSVHSLLVTAATEADRAEMAWHKDPRTTVRYIRTGQDLDRL